MDEVAQAIASDSVLASHGVISVEPDHFDMCFGVLPAAGHVTGFNSHFFTVDSEECGAVHNADPGWIFEGNAFGARMPVDGACPAGMVTVYRLYNDRARFLDSNHRYVVRPELYAEMLARGWIGEGVAMCLPQSP